eukprot:TRINITY_DN1305_c0_g1_i2.p1 TRINITY_DN1305_c0_g1~~TRINITY_DN1305_c0_g1_i2.p1  ORF type:complete len:568 (+),score=175.51 TRINITY_DN1305_c0_g1_i2:66-1769(+)
MCIRDRSTWGPNTDSQQKQDTEADTELMKKAKEEINRSFQDLLLDEELNNFWINVIELVTILNDHFPSALTAHSPIFARLQPILESFLIIYKIFNEEEVVEDRRHRVTVRRDTAPKKAISKIANVDLVENQGEQPSVLSIRDLKLEINDLFRVMVERNRKVINLMVKQNIGLLSDSLNIVVRKMPQILDFENKKKHFRSEMDTIRGERHYRSLDIRVSRNNIFQDSFAQLAHKSANEMKAKLHVNFIGEEGEDAGGLTREWFVQLSREIFNPDYALFKTNVNGVTFMPSPHSNVNQHHLQYFKFVGRIVAKALMDNHQLDAYFTRSFYKHILGQPLTYHDMEDIDPSYYKNLKWILENDVSPLELNFSYEDNTFDQHVIIDLIPNGRNILVTEENKQDYVREICYAKMAKDIKAQIEAFLDGFHELIPAHLIAIFDSKELELMISGLPDIDLQDLKDNTEYHNYSRDSAQVKWFWEVIETFDQQSKAAFLQFVTGTSKVPLEGFKALRGIGGVQRFSIHKAYDSNRLPTAHTCFNQLDLPEYPTKEVLMEKLVLSINEGREGFHGFR